ncbi:MULTISPECIES: phosphate acyltransferase PlsX [Thermoactinomyces]|jgi:phosphate acyltransferase|uniref:Phosphate acyltransferase n=1 Tax=Thermoactinomyces vulgaris TaxID=2026 RepID=A0ABS0QHJ8_THEVU|nr:MULTISPECIES: phosphate acyltransferase PlsX [Thermoactinomyces]KFZ40579.1 phosphate acyltransferase [Thermoactinomyces sp. Gus2-1]KYQ87019.1 phosphate acyltransferase [Thermoactinomyces sp. AS95]MBA4551599.1 phosphate acyltransferase PlsX [Thermoactinomyces vulgaris]MBA4596522.1 phosphate acyltransferase PlsX [Thermoactinomyces vulgaris]MBH8582747.1 phosphate acyltransferase PlsX [Thermoactinomyces sp. CICC 10735]
MRIAIDAHGGDHAPDAVVEGIRQAKEKWPDLKIILIGLKDMEDQLALDGVEFRPVTEKIEPEDKPTQAVRRKKDSSIVVGCQMVRKKEADAFISGGNTGALMAAGFFHVGRLKGVDRPALAPVFPTLNGKGILVLDVGANPEAKPEHLRQYATMGSIYAEKVLGFESPRVGLLNIGTEEGKGTELTREAYALIEKDLAARFVGNVEARDILEGPCEVLVCDGFTGNVLLKNTEGVAKAVFGRLKQELTANLMTKSMAALLKPRLKKFAQAMDYKEHGGAPLLGLKGPVIKAHGSSDARAFCNAIRQTRRFLQHDVISRMEEELS